MKYFPVIACKRQALAKIYDSYFYGNSKIKPLNHDYKTVVPHIYVVRIYGKTDIQALRTKLLEVGIQTGVHYQPNHWLSYYSENENNANSLQVTEKQYSQLLTLPLHTDLTEKDVKII